jgi:hypothetical protein
MTRNIKLIEVTNSYASDCEYSYKLNPRTEWIQVSEEEYKLLLDQSVRDMFKTDKYDYNTSIMMISEVDVSYKNLLATLEPILTKAKKEKEDRVAKAKLIAEQRKKTEEKRKKAAEEKAIKNAEEILKKAGRLK